MKKYYIIALSLLFMCSSAFAQGEFRLSEQLFSRIKQNPSAIGNNKDIQIFNVNRMQWAGMGFDESQTSTLINVHSYFESIQSGVGLSLSYDELGIANSTLNAKLAYAYNLDLSENSLLSLGLAAGVIHKSFDPARHIWLHPTDPSIPADILSLTDLDVDFGLELSTRYLLVGASSNHLTNIGKEVSSLIAPTTINAYARGLVSATKDIMIAPAVVYTNIGMLNQEVEVYQNHIVELNATAFYKNQYWLGAGYRLNNALSLSAGLEWNKAFRIGYAYELSVGDVSQLTSSTHELMLSIVIPSKK
ncbi:MAG: PorP/SprF family type IX secretion system membrane protein [Paludibacteraceae bacterium]|nr:PorP/SprF family type IX secretion system membrane protein [Paludibacteraceae bacterium]MBP6284878.1 PorP/SprF family type IX secretion system membrane protein [Paludibacteraceae bacterium]